MISANDALMDAAIQHQVDLSKYTNQVVRRMMSILNRSDDRLAAELAASLADMTASTFSVDRLESLLGSVRSMNSQAYSQVEQELRKELQEFVDFEAAFQRQMVLDVVPASVNVAALDAQVVYASALSRPFQGVLLSGVLRDLDQKTARMIRESVALGFTEGKTTDQIVRQIRGTRAEQYRDGLMAVTRRDAESITRTAIGHMAGFVRDRFVEANTDIIKAVKWLSTLDLRTSPMCRARDGKLYDPQTHKPQGHDLPWLSGPGRLHWCCRSAQTNVLKSFAEQGIDLPGSMNGPDSRASMDGLVPSHMTYNEWLAKQPMSRQIEVLGPLRAKLFNKGGLPLDELYSQRGQYLTLQQLKDKHPRAFKKSGVAVP